MSTSDTQVSANEIEFRGVSKDYHRRHVLEDISFVVAPDTFSVLFGPPGCGKSVILRLLTGLEHPTSGKVFLRGADVARVSSGDRNIGYVPQSFALYPHYNVYENIAYPLKLIRAKREEIDSTVRRTAEMLRIDHLLRKTPDQLSGGEKQRVAIARGMSKKTDIYVFDDPLTGLDFKLREQLFDDMRDLQETLHATFLYTTSDPLETLILAEHVFVIFGGHVVESGPLERVYADPARRETTEMLGFPRANLLSGKLTSRDGGSWCQTPLFEFAVGSAAPIEGSARVSVAIRPQDLAINPLEGNGYVTFPADVLLREDLGGEWIIHLEASGTPLLAVVRHDQAHLVSEDRVTVGVEPRAALLFSADRGERLPGV